MESTVTMRDEIVTVFGGSGFLGRYVVEMLANRGYRIRAAVRRPDLAGHLQPLGFVGQIYPVQANVRNPASVAQAIKGAHAVVNCVGILVERGAQKFVSVHAEGAKNVAEAAARDGVKHLVHISALGADKESEADYPRANAKGEENVRRAFPDAVILRPSLLFGPEDSFFNKFAFLAQFLPFLPLVGGGKTKFQPVFVNDVAEVVARGVAGKLASNIYELGGPEIVTFKQILRRILQETNRGALLLPVPFRLGALMSYFLQLLPGPLLTPDQVRMLKGDYTVSEEAKRAGRTLEGLGVAPASLAAILPTYLWRYRKGGQFAEREEGALPLS